MGGIARILVVDDESVRKALAVENQTPLLKRRK